MIIGRFTATGDGVWAGVIRTLTINAKIRFVPNDNRESDSSPAFRIFIGPSEVGTAWLKRASGERSNEYLSVRMDCPGLAEPFCAALFMVIARAKQN
jgi:uncharacterized protein (DUF736 family)